VNTCDKIWHTVFYGWLIFAGIYPKVEVKVAVICFLLVVRLLQVYQWNFAIHKLQSERSWLVLYILQMHYILSVRKSPQYYFVSTLAVK
jgi:hypothetical protein